MLPLSPSCYPILKYLTFYSHNWLHLLFVDKLIRDLLYLLLSCTLMVLKTRFMALCCYKTDAG